MTKDELLELLETYTPQELLNKHIKGEITLNESQIRKLIKMRGAKNERENKK